METDKSKIPERVLNITELDEGAELTAPSFTPDAMPAITSTGRSRPGIKVQDGCDLRCTYCIVWKARGASTSRPIAEVVNAVEEAAARGAGEVVLTGVNLGRYRDTSSGKLIDVAGLVDTLLEKTSIGRIRLSSLEPQDVTPAFLDVIEAAQNRFAPFLHLPLQSGSNDVLKRMHRAYSADEYCEIVDAVKMRLPHMSFGCDLIVGFPGETDEEFEESLAVARSVEFSRMHIFKYSQRPTTPAALDPNQVSPQIKQERSAAAHELAAQLRASQAARLVGRKDLVAVESPLQGVSGGLFDVELDREAISGELLPVTIVGTRGDVLLAHALKEL